MSLKPLTKIILALVLSASPVLAQTHPRLFFDAADVPALQARAATEPYASMAEQMVQDLLSVDYWQRGGNFAASYLLTGDETWAEMSAYRALDYISNTDRWENDSNFGLRRGIDIVAVMMLYDFCYNSDFWTNYIVPATLDPVTYNINGVDMPIPGTGAGIDPTGKWHTSYTGRSITVPEKYVGLPLRTAISQALRNNGDSNIRSGGSGWPGNDAIGNNWFAVRYGSAALAYLACDETGTGANFDLAISRLKTHLTANLGTSPLGMGWNPEGIAYAQYPGWTTYPLAIALKRMTGRDLVAEHPAMRFALWSTWQGVLPIERKSRLGDLATGTGLGVKPDFDDDHNIWDGEGTGALAFAFAYNDDPGDDIPDFDYRPGIKWLYNRIAGAKGDRLWDSASGNGIYSILYYPEDSVMPEQNPDNVWGRIYADTTYGAYMFRSGYQDADFSNQGSGFNTPSTDFVTQTTLNLRPALGGHGGPDAMSLRLIGLGVPWAVGSGRSWTIPAQSSLMPYDPTTMGPGTLGVVPFGGEVLDSFLRPSTGDGYLIMRQDTSDTGCSNHTRRLIVDYSGDAGAPALLITYDTTADSTAWWRLNTLYSNAVDTSVPGQFTLTSTDGHQLVGKVLYPVGATIRTGEIGRGNGYSYKDLNFNSNKWVDFPAGGDGHALIAMVVVPAGDPVPLISATGSPATGFTVTAGAASFTLDAAENTITSPNWNPPSVVINDPTEGDFYYPAPQDIPVSGTAEDDEAVARIEIFLDDILQSSTNYASASVNLGPVSLTGVELGDHVIRVAATDNAGNTKSVSRTIRLTHSQPPAVSLTSPGSSSQLFAGQVVTLSGQVSDGDSSLDRVEIWYANRVLNGSKAKVGNAVISSTDNTWSYNWSNFPVGTHDVWAIAYSTDGDISPTETVILKGSLFFSDIPHWGDVANYSQRADFNGTGRWAVWTDEGDLRLHLRGIENYDYSASMTALLGSNNRTYPNFRLSYKAKIDQDISTAPYYFTFFGQGDAGPVVFDAQAINSVARPNSWTSAGIGTRVWYHGNSGYRPEVGYTYNIHATSDPGYPNAADNDFAGIPNAGWNTVLLERVGKNLKVWINGTEILDATNNYLSTRGEVGLGNERATGSRIFFDDIDFSFLDEAGQPLINTDATISFTTPVAFADLQAGQLVNISGTAVDPDGIARIEVFAGAELLGEPEMSGDSWSLNWTPARGQYALVLRVTDSAGFVNESAALRCKATASGGAGGNAAPTVTIARDETVVGSLVVNGVASDSDGSIAGVQVFKDGILVGNAALSGGAWAYTFSSLEPGSYALTARAFDNLGSSVLSSPLNLVIDAPAVAITAPADGSDAVVGLPLTLQAVASDADGISSLSFWANGGKVGEASFLGGFWTLSWTPRFYRSYEVTATATDQWGTVGVSAPVSVNVVGDPGPTGSLVTYVGQAGQQSLLDAMELSDGTLLVAGSADNLDWTSAPMTQLSASGLPDGATGKTAFLMHLAADQQSILGIYHLPSGEVANLRWIKSTNKPGEPTGALYVSGQCNNSTDGTYFIARLDDNFVSGIPSGFEWVKTATMSNARGDNVGLQTWDVGGDGRVFFVDETPDALRVFALDANGDYLKLDALRGSHFSTTEFTDANRQAGIGTELPATTISAISFPADLRSWTDEDRLAILPDGNGSIKQGTWPYDIFYAVQDKDGGTDGPIEYGYTGYKSAGRWRVGGIAVDRETNDFYIGFNLQSRFWDEPANKIQPDFEPAVIGYTAAGALKWWSRLYHEVVDTNNNGSIDPGETRLSSPDQYVDALAIDYSGSDSKVVVNARAHGNNTSNLWSGNGLAANPGGQGFQNMFTGTEGNIHISWIGKLRADDGTALHASWLSGFFRNVQLTQSLYPEPIHDGWPSHNSGWPNLTTTRADDGSMKVDALGRVYVAGVGPRMVTTFNAYQKLPKITATVSEGISPWSAFARVYESDLATLVYSSALTGVWTYPTPDSFPEGADNTALLGIAPSSSGAIVVGHQVANSGVPKGNPVPVNKVPVWGASNPVDQTALFANLSFTTSANIPPSCALVQPSGTVSVTPGNSLAIDASASDADGAVVRVDFYANGDLVFSDTSATYGLSWTPPGAEGTVYTVQAVAVDDKGASTASGTAVVRMELAPTVAISSPPEGALLQIGLPVTIGVVATDTAPGTVTRVDFLVNGTKVGEDSTYPFSYDWTPTSTGSRQLLAKATDNDGAVGTSSLVNVTVTDANVPPTIAITLPGDGDTLNEALPLNLTAEAFDSGAVLEVEFFLNGQSLGNAVNTSGNTWTLVWNPSLLGSLVFTAVATDNQSGSTTSDPVAVTMLSGTAPAAPQDLVALPLSWRRVQLDWTDSSTNESGFEIERKTGAGAFDLLATVASGTTVYVDTTCDPETAYTYRVRSVNLKGESAFTNEAMVLTPPQNPVTYYWKSAAENLNWDTASQNWTDAPNSSGNPVLFAEGDDSIADFNVDPAGSVVLTEDLLIFGVRNLDTTITGSGVTLQLGEGGIVLDGTGGLSVPTTILASQTWTNSVSGQGWIGNGPFFGAKDIILTWAPVSGNGGLGNSGNGAWNNFEGRVRLVAGTWVGGTDWIKIENGDFNNRAIWELINWGAFFNMRGNWTIGGLAGNGRVRADLANRVLVIDAPSGQDETFAGEVEQRAYGVSIRKEGLGTQTFSGLIGQADTNGSITVNAGTFLINGTRTASSVSGLVSVNPGATLGGSGVVEGEVSVAAGGILSPGDAADPVSTLQLQGSLTLADLSIVNVQLDPGELANSDGIAIGESLVLPENGLVRLRISTVGVDPQADGRFKLFEISNANLSHFESCSWELDYGDNPWYGGNIVLDSGAIYLVNLRTQPQGLEILETGVDTFVPEGDSSVTDSFNIRLSSQPASNVTLHMDPGSQLGLDKTSLVFTPQNWGLPQVVTVSAVNDELVEGAGYAGIHYGQVEFAVESADPAWHGMVLPLVEVTIADDELNTPPQVAITQPGRPDVYLEGLTGSILLLEASALDQGLANAPWLAWSWTQVSGPGTAVFTGADSPNCSATFDTPGDYLLRVTVDDGLYTAFDDLYVRVGNLPDNGPTDSLALWLKMDDYTAYEGTFSDGQPIGRTSDSSGNELLAQIIKGNAGPHIDLPDGGKTGVDGDGAFKIGTTNYGTGGLMQVSDNDNLDNTGALTISLWWRPTSLILNSYVFSRKHSYHLSSGSTPGKLTFECVSNDSNDNHTLNTTFAAGQWYHLAFVFDGSLPVEQRMRIYVDGQLDTEGVEQATSIGTWSEILRIGRGEYGDRINSKIDDFRIYRRGLSNIEVGQIVNGVNRVPVVDSGSDEAATTTAPLALAGSVVDPDSTPALQWSKVSGPGNVEFSDPHAAASDVWFSSAGSYVLRLVASDQNGATMGDDLTVTVTGPLQPILTLNADNGSVATDPAQTRFTDLTTTVLLTAIPGDGFEFAGWSGDLTGSTNPSTLLMDGDKLVTALFTPIQYTLSLSGGNGLVLADPNNSRYAAGSVVSLAAYPLEGYYFAGWSGDVTGSENPATVVVNGPTSATATFLAYRTLSVDSFNGTVLVEPLKERYRQDEVVSLTAIPDAGYTFAGWSGGLVSTENPVAVVMSVSTVVSANFNSGYTAWTTLQFGGSSDPAITGSLVDPDKDGVPNLMEYALGGDPLRADAAAPDFVTVEEDGELYLAIEFERPVGLSDLNYILEISGDLQGWDIDPPVLSSIPLSGGREHIRLRASSPYTGGPQFLRLRIEIVE